ncbi:MAG: roadblock/LC7 domain-containing protein [Candidatus Lokiarchaeota archaeon]|nr:roadblock/LC7 domain-containing protein [Candidatus Lokiarchaeota archaeon]
MSDDEPRVDLMQILNEIESSTDLEACAIVTKEGLRIAHATGTNTDADIFSALTAVILSMGYKAINELGHGDFKEVIIRGTEGYTIVTSIDDEHVLVGAGRNPIRIGYSALVLRKYALNMAPLLQK